MATMVTSVATVGATAANTACRPSMGKVNAYLKDSKTLKYCIPNEHICAEIARHIGLPVPASTICRKDGSPPDYYFASMNFNLTSSVLPPIDPAQCVAAVGFDSVGVVLFDILVANNDRHIQNLSLDTSQPMPRLTVFDHSHAFFGHVDGQGNARLIAMQNKLGITESGRRHCLLNALTGDAHFSEWIGRIKALPDYLIDSVCDATVPMGFITAAEASAAKDFLKTRKNGLEGLISANRREFASISQWSLFA
jgi:hypothetical protein